MADKREPTAAEAMLFFSIVKHTRNKADVDWNAVATEAGFKNADVAKVSLILSVPCSTLSSRLLIHHLIIPAFVLTQTPLGPLRPGQAKAGNLY
jgi:hypothetical protein